MRKFIEILKEQNEEQIANGEPQEMIRVDIDDLPAAEILDRIAALRAGAGWTSEDSAARLHICHHDDVPPAPCELIPEDEIT